MIDLSPKREWVDNAHHSRSDLEVAQSIAAECESMAGFQPNLEILRAFDLDPAKPLRLLDFGAGMLRYTVGLLEMGPLWHVTAYDSPEMLARGERIFNGKLRPNRSRYSLWPATGAVGSLDWKLGSSGLCYTDPAKFDAIIAILALQHIDADPLKEWLRIFKGHTNKLCVYGRRSLDDLEVCPDNWTDCWRIITQVWEPIKGFTLPPYPAKLRVDYFERGNAEDHFGMILKPRD